MGKKGSRPMSNAKVLNARGFGFSASKTGDGKKAKAMREQLRSTIFLAFYEERRHGRPVPRDIANKTEWFNVGELAKIVADAQAKADTDRQGTEA